VITMKTTAYQQAMKAQRNQALRGSSVAPLPGWRQVSQMKPGWTVGGCAKGSGRARPPLSACARPAAIGRIGSPAQLGEGSSRPGGLVQPLGMIDWYKIGPAFLLNFGVTYGMLEIFPAYLKDKLSAKHESERSSARWKIILASAVVLTGINNVLIPWFATKPDAKV